jgi:type IV pilus assembly protein PilA
VRKIIEQLRASKEEDEGFTLIELLVVLLIIGILLAIAIPTYLSVTGGAKKSAAQSNLNTALTAAKAYYTNNNGAYPSGSNASATLANALASAGTSLQYVAGATTSSSTISVGVLNTSVVVLGASDGTNCYYVADLEQPDTSISSNAGTYWAETTSGSCDATGTLPAAANWSTSPTTTGSAA